MKKLEIFSLEKIMMGSFVLISLGLIGWGLYLLSAPFKFIKANITDSSCINNRCILSISYEIENKPYTKTNLSTSVPSIENNQIDIAYTDPENPIILSPTRRWIYGGALIFGGIIIFGIIFYLYRNIFKTKFFL